MRRITTASLALTIAATGVIAGTVAVLGQGASDLRIGLVTDVGTIDDRNFNQYSWEGTLAGAEALGSADEAGSITPGKLANLVAIPLAEDAGRLSSELLAALLADDRGPSAAWLRGNVVV